MMDTGIQSVIVPSTNTEGRRVKVRVTTSTKYPEAIYPWPFLSSVTRQDIVDHYAKAHGIKNYTHYRG